MRTERIVPTGPATATARKPGTSVLGTSARVSPSSSPAGAQAEPRTSATSCRSAPVNSASRGAAARATPRGSTWGWSRPGPGVVTPRDYPPPPSTGSGESERRGTVHGRAQAGAQFGDVVVRSTAGLGRVGQHAEVARAGQAPLVGVEHVDPGRDLAVEGLDPDADLA